MRIIRLRRIIRLLARLQDVLTDESASDEFCFIIRLNSTEFIPETNYPSETGTSTRIIRLLYTAISRKVVGKSARDNPKRHYGWFSVPFFSKKFERIGTRGHGNVFARAKGKQQK